MNSESNSKEKTGLPSKRAGGREKSGSLDYLRHSFEETAVRTGDESVEDVWQGDLEEEKVEPQNPRGLFAILGLVILVLVGSGVIYLRSSSVDEVGSDRKRVSSSGKTSDLEERVYLGKLLENSTPEELQDIAVEVVQAFMESETLEEAARHVLGGEKRLAILQDFYARPENSLPNGFQSVVGKKENSLDGIFYLNVFALDLDRRPHQFIVIPQDDEMLIDWACSVSYGELSKEAFFSQKPKMPVKMRYFASFVSEEPSRPPTVQLEEFELPEGLEIEPEPQYLRLSDLEGKEVFEARISFPTRGHTGMAYLRRNPQIRLPVQLQMAWNHEIDEPEIASLDRLWWFDFEMIDQASDQASGKVPDDSKD